MKGFLNHLLMTLKLNFRNPQAMVFGYLVPVFFLFAFGSYFFHGGSSPLSTELGQLVTISVLGGACFGMTVTFVSESERGVWRRYRLTPLPTPAFVASIMIARYCIVLTSAALQVGLAMWVYGTRFPKFPGQMLISFTFVCFAFLGIGLVIAMIANSAGAVQALGQALFMPMIVIGGVGIPLSTFRAAKWVKHLAAFLPGIYAVKAMDSTIPPKAEGLLAGHGLFHLFALTLIGLAGCVAASQLFRWENEQKNAPSAKWWVLVALATWAVVGLLAERSGLTVLR